LELTVRHGYRKANRRRTAKDRVDKVPENPGDKAKKSDF